MRDERQSNSPPALFVVLSRLAAINASKDAQNWPKVRSTDPPSSANAGTYRVAVSPFLRRKVSERIAMNYFRILLVILAVAGQVNHAMSMELASANSELPASVAILPVAKAPAEMSLVKLAFYVTLLVVGLMLLVSILREGPASNDADKSAVNTGNSQSTDWQERVLDAGSQMNMWEAVKRGDSEALREELKLMELRAIRRQNQR